MRHAFSKAICLSVLFSLAACTGSKKEGFALENSPLRFETADLGDPTLLAEVNGLKITKDQILDKSQVLKDLDSQANDFLIGLAYMKAVEKFQVANGAPATPAAVATEIAEEATPVAEDVKPAAKPTAAKPAVRARSAAPVRPSASGRTVQIYLPESERTIDEILIRFDRKPVGGLGIAYATSEDANLIAKLGDINVTRDDVELQHGLLQSINQRRFQETVTQLQEQLSRILINVEAEKAGQTLQDYIPAKVFAGKNFEVSTADIEAHVKAIGSSLADFDEAAQANLKTTLKGRKEQTALEQYVADNLVKGPIKTSIVPPHANLKLSEEWQPVLGYKDAPVAVVAFTGSTCPDCPDTIKLLKDIMKEHDGYLKLNLIHTFNNGDGIARLFSEASLCIDGQKRGKSVDFLNALSSQRGRVDESKFYEWVSANKLNEEDFRKCLVEGKSRELVNQHLAYGRGVGVLANPTLWIEGRMIEGVVRLPDVEKVLAEKITESGETKFSAFMRRMKGYFGKD